MTQVPKRRLSLFSFGSNSNTANTIGSGSTGQTSPESGSGSGSTGFPFGLGKGKTLSAMSPTNLSRRSSSQVPTIAANSHTIDEDVGGNNGNLGSGTPDQNAVPSAVGGHTGSARDQKLSVDTSTPQVNDSAINQPNNKPGNNLHPQTATRTGSTASDQQFQSPISSPSMLDNELTIFERSVQDYDNPPPPPTYTHSQDGSRRPTLSRLRTKSGHNSSISLSNFKNEDYIPPALDATTSILNDSKTNLDDVDIIYCTRRNSSVLGLNMALGRSTPSRKNSVYSMNQLHHQTSPNPNNLTSASASYNPNCNCNSNSVNNNPCGEAIPEMQPDSPFDVDSQSPSNLSPRPVPMNLNAPSNNMSHPMSPTSPPKLTSSKSSISFYSYADMINNDEYAKRPSFKNSYSHGFVPTRKDSVNSIKFNSAASAHSDNGTPSHFNSANSKKYNSNLNKFLISPESSDLEEELGKPKSINSKSINDNESLVSSSVGDCLRQNKTEISN